MMIGSEIGIERADCLACRRNSAALLEHENLGTFLGGRGCGGKAAVAGTDHNDIDVDGLIIFSGMAGLSRHEPCRPSAPSFASDELVLGAQPVSEPGRSKRARCSKARQKATTIHCMVFHDPSPVRARERIRLPLGGVSTTSTLQEPPLKTIALLRVYFFKIPGQKRYTLKQVRQRGAIGHQRTGAARAGRKSSVLISLSPKIEMPDIMIRHPPTMESSVIMLPEMKSPKRTVSAVKIRTLPDE